MSQLGTTWWPIPVSKWIIGPVIYIHISSGISRLKPLKKLGFNCNSYNPQTIRGMNHQVTMREFSPLTISKRSKRRSFGQQPSGTHLIHRWFGPIGRRQLLLPHGIARPWEDLRILSASGA